MKLAGIEMDTNSMEVLLIYSLDSCSAFLCDIMESISGRGRETAILTFLRTPSWLRVPITTLLNSGGIISERNNI